MKNETKKTAYLRVYDETEDEFYFYADIEVDADADESTIVDAFVTHIAESWRDVEINDDGTRELFVFDLDITRKLLDHKYDVMNDEVYNEVEIFVNV